MRDQRTKWEGNSVGILPTNRAARHPYEKNELQLTCKSVIYRRINLKWAIDLNVKPEVYIFYLKK